MLLLQVADIHFRHPDCGSDVDPERPYRTALVNDVRRRVATLGPVDAVLVAGDIAYSGLAEEYAAARAWLKELTEAASCSLADVFVVPGNHDVHRSTIKAERSVQNAQAAVANAVGQGRERELIDQFRDGKTGPALLAPLAAYNLFAAEFNCQVYSPEKLRWHQERALEYGFRLRIYGLTSTFLSGAGAPRDEEDTKLSLYLSSFQTAIDPFEELVNLVVCHHPPEWFRDHDAVDEAICARAAIHLFGHKHRQRIHRDVSYVRFSAGAVNPDRHQVGWEPGYNLVKVTVAEESGANFLDVEAHLFCWQANPDGFHPKRDKDERPVFTHRIALPRLRPPVAPAPVGAPLSTTPLRGTSGAGPAALRYNSDSEVALSELQTRNMVLRFWALASSQRREIAKNFQLLKDDEMKLPEPERYGRALVRAREMGLIDQVAAEIARLEGN